MVNNSRHIKIVNLLAKQLKGVIQSLPQDTDKRVTVVRHIAQELNVIPKNNYSTSTSTTFLTNRIARINY
ncbi:unnamed protein product [Rotaria sp. Silwood2]|nr:unnamed protein product [Rotaria sp. Silwood2]CAF4815570.1 unnamed protein product [Rotaria sp. Silwood2]